MSFEVICHAIILSWSRDDLRFEYYDLSIKLREIDVREILDDD